MKKAKRVFTESLDKCIEAGGNLMDEMMTGDSKKTNPTPNKNPFFIISPGKI